MNLKRETICQDTLAIIQDYYHLNTEPLFSVLSPDCVWLGIGNLLVSGAGAIKEQFKDGFVMPPFEVQEPDFRLIDTGSKEQLIVLGEYMLTPSQETEVICATKQRLTFCYRLEQKGYRLYHMHVSNEYSELIGEEIFPVQMSRQTYQYVQSLLKENAKRGSHRLAVKEHGGLSFVDTDMIQYISALERESVLHFVNESRQVQTPIKEMEGNLPDYFYRPHRSYYVNCNYIARIERYKLTLITGEELPIPKMRYMQIREELKEKMEKKKNMGRGR